jgi:hypothetical protein
VSRWTVRSELSPSTLFHSTSTVRSELSPSTLFHSTSTVRSELSPSTLFHSTSTVKSELSPSTLFHSTSTVRSELSPSTLCPDGLRVLPETVLNEHKMLLESVPLAVRPEYEYKETDCDDYGHIRFVIKHIFYSEMLLTSFTTFRTAYTIQPLH